MTDNAFGYVKVEDGKIKVYYGDSSNPSSMSFDSPEWVKALTEYPKLKEELDLIKRNWDRGSMSAVEIRNEAIKSFQQIKEENQKLKAENEELKSIDVFTDTRGIRLRRGICIHVKNSDIWVLDSLHNLIKVDKLQQEIESLRQLKQRIEDRIKLLGEYTKITPECGNLVIEQLRLRGIIIELQQLLKDTEGKK